MSHDRVQFRYVGDEPRTVSMLPTGDQRLLGPDELFDVPAAHWAAYACQPALYQALSEDPDRAAMDTVLDAVGDDPAAAADALRVERMSPKPRPKLLAELEGRAAAPAAVATAPVPAEEYVPADQLPPSVAADASTSTSDPAVTGREED